MSEVREWRVALPPELPYFQGHFEGDPVLPAAASLHWLVLRHAREAWPALGPPRRLSRLKFRRALRPGALVRVTLARDGLTLDFALATAEGAAADGRVEFTESW